MELVDVRLDGSIKIDNLWLVKCLLGRIYIDDQIQNKTDCVDYNPLVSFNNY